MTITKDTKAMAGAPKYEKRRLRIACCSMPMSGHLTPLMSLAETLVAQYENNDDASSDDANNVVLLVTLCYGAKRVESSCEAKGIQLVALSLGKGFDSDQDISEFMVGEIPFPLVADRVSNQMDEALSAFRPDVIVSDFACLASQEYAASRNIPLVVNWTGPFETLRDFLQPVVNVSDKNFYIAAGGLFLSYSKITVGSLLFVFNINNMGTMMKRIQKSVNCGNSLYLVNSFWGFEKPRFLFYPNVLPIGPIGKPLPTSPDFSQSHPDLHLFLQTARQEERKILLVTTGSMVQMEEWMVKLLYEAFAKLASEYSASIVWSLKEEQQGYLSEENRRSPCFYFSTWLPQPALLASDFVDAVLTHCGWGGTLECISGGKPLVVLPFFADQMINARLLLAAGCAVSIAALPSFNMDNSGRSSYVGPRSYSFGPKGLFEKLADFSRKGRLAVEPIVEGCAKVLTDPRYKTAASHLRALSTGPGMGHSAARGYIEHAARHGLGHLTESGSSNGAGESSVPAKHASRLVGHRPLGFTLALCALTAGAAAMATNAALRRRA